MPLRWSGVWLPLLLATLQAGAQATAERVTTRATLPAGYFYEYAVVRDLVTSVGQQYGGQLFMQLRIETSPGDNDDVVYHVSYGDVEYPDDNPMWLGMRLKSECLAGMAFEVRAAADGTMRLPDDLEPLRDAYVERYLEVLPELDALKDGDELTEMALAGLRAGVTASRTASREQMNVVLLADLIALTAGMGIDVAEGEAVEHPGGPLPDTFGAELVSVKTIEADLAVNGYPRVTIDQRVDLESVKDAMKARSTGVDESLPGFSIDDMVEEMYGSFWFEFELLFDPGSGAPFRADMVRRIQSEIERRAEITRLRRLDWGTLDR